MASSTQRTFMERLLLRKSVEQVQRETENSQLKRTLGPWNLVFLGIGCIIGAGIFVLTGTAAANFAGPAVSLSFVLAGLAFGNEGGTRTDLSAEDLAYVMFPVGHMQKSDVRELATTGGLRTAAKPDSQDVCFIGTTIGRAPWEPASVPRLRTVACGD